jgi:chromosome partitioning protein
MAVFKRKKFHVKHSDAEQFHVKHTEDDSTASLVTNESPQHPNGSDQDITESTPPRSPRESAPISKNPGTAETGREDDAPLAREIAEMTRRRRMLAADDLPLPNSPRVLTVANQKGGVGKTTSTVNLAAALARTGARVLVIDLDPQGNASTALGVEHRSETPSVYDVIINDVPMSDVMQKSSEFDTLFCIPATIHLAGAEIELVSLVAREQRLRRALDLFLEENPFHYVFIDCPPSLGLLTINAFVAAREVVIPIQCEYYALEGLSQLLKNIELIEKHLNPNLDVSTILLTMYDGRTNLANQVAQDVRAHFPTKVLDTLIPRSVRISEAPSYGQTVISYDANSPGSLSYREAAAEIARRGAPV